MESQDPIDYDSTKKLIMSIKIDKLQDLLDDCKSNVEKIERDISNAMGDVDFAYKMWLLVRKTHLKYILSQNDLEAIERRHNETDVSTRIRGGSFSALRTRVVGGMEEQSMSVTFKDEDSDSSLSDFRDEFHAPKYNLDINTKEEAFQATWLEIQGFVPMVGRSNFDLDGSDLAVAFENLGNSKFLDAAIQNEKNAIARIRKDFNKSLKHRSKKDQFLNNQARLIESMIEVSKQLKQETEDILSAKQDIIDRTKEIALEAVKTSLDFFKKDVAISFMVGQELNIIDFSSAGTALEHVLKSATNGAELKPLITNLFNTPEFTPLFSILKLGKSDLLQMFQVQDNTNDAAPTDELVAAGKEALTTKIKNGIGGKKIVFTPVPEAREFLKKSLELKEAQARLENASINEEGELTATLNTAEKSLQSTTIAPLSRGIENVNAKQEEAKKVVEDQQSQPNLIEAKLTELKAELDNTISHFTGELTKIQTTVENQITNIEKSVKDFAKEQLKAGQSEVASTVNKIQAGLASEVTKGATAVRKGLKLHQIQKGYTALTKKLNNAISDVVGNAEELGQILNESAAFINQVNAKISEVGKYISFAGNALDYVYTAFKDNKVSFTSQQALTQVSLDLKLVADLYGTVTLTAQSIAIALGAKISGDLTLKLFGVELNLKGSASIIANAKASYNKFGFSAEARIEAAANVSASAQIAKLSLNVGDFRFSVGLSASFHAEASAYAEASVKAGINSKDGSGNPIQQWIPEDEGEIDVSLAVKAVAGAKVGVSGSLIGEGSIEVLNTQELLTQLDDNTGPGITINGVVKKHADYVKEKTTGPQLTSVEDIANWIAVNKEGIIKEELVSLGFAHHISVGVGFDLSAGLKITIKKSHIPFLMKYDVDFHLSSSFLHGADLSLKGSFMCISKAMGESIYTQVKTYTRDKLIPQLSSAMRRELSGQIRFATRAFSRKMKEAARSIVHWCEGLLLRAKAYIGTVRNDLQATFNSLLDDLKRMKDLKALATVNAQITAAISQIDSFSERLDTFITSTQKVTEKIATYATEITGNEEWTYLQSRFSDFIGLVNEHQLAFVEKLDIGAAATSAQLNKLQELLSHDVMTVIRQGYLDYTQEDTKENRKWAKILKNGSESAPERNSSKSYMGVLLIESIWLAREAIKQTYEYQKMHSLVSEDELQGVIEVRSDRDRANRSAIRAATEVFIHQYEEMVSSISFLKSGFAPLKDILQEYRDAHYKAMTDEDQLTKLTLRVKNLNEELEELEEQKGNLNGQLAALDSNIADYKLQLQKWEDLSSTEDDVPTIELKMQQALAQRKKTERLYKQVSETIQNTLDDISDAVVQESYHSDSFKRSQTQAMGTIYRLEKSLRLYQHRVQMLVEPLLGQLPESDATQETQDENSKQSTVDALVQALANHFKACASHRASMSQMIQVAKNGYDAIA